MLTCHNLFQKNTRNFRVRCLLVEIKCYVIRVNGNNGIRDNGIKILKFDQDWKIVLKTPTVVSLQQETTVSAT